MTAAALLVAGTAFSNADPITYWLKSETSNSNSTLDFSSLGSWTNDNESEKHPSSLTDENSIFAISNDISSATISGNVEMSTLRISRWMGVKLEFSGAECTISANAITRDGSNGITLRIGYDAVSTLDTIGELVLFSSAQDFTGMDSLTRHWTDGTNFVSVWTETLSGTWDGEKVLSGSSATETGIFSSATEARTAISESDRPYALVLTNNTLSIVSAIPEPSAFGLVAGAGALALVAARRRRRAK